MDSVLYGSYDHSLPFNFKRSFRPCKTESPPDSGIIFFSSKNEKFHLRDNYKVFQRKLRNKFHVKITQLRNELPLRILLTSKMVIIAGIQAPLTVKEISILRNYINDGGSVFVMAEENSNIGFYNDFIQHFGITVVKDSTIRCTFLKYTHPKECLIEKAMICPGLLQTNLPGVNNLNILYPFGCTLNVEKPSHTIISSGSTSYPTERPLGAIYQSPVLCGKLIVYGSGHTFTNKYIDKEENLQLLDFFLNILGSPDDMNLQQDVDIDDSELNDYTFVPNTVYSSQQVRGCLQDCDELLMPGCVNSAGDVDPMRLVDSSIFSENPSILPDVLDAYDELKIKKGKLTLIKPGFDAPWPRLRPAVYEPFFRSLPPPPLELFDLDEEFASPKKRLGQQTTKCTDNDLDVYVKSIGNILEIPLNEEEKKDPKAVLHVMLKEMCTFKNSDPEIESEVSQCQVKHSEIELSEVEQSEIGESEIELSEVEQSEIGESEIELSEVGQSEIEQSEVEQSEVEQSEVEQSEIEQSEVEQSEIGQSEIEQSEVEHSEPTVEPAESLEYDDTTSLLSEGFDSTDY